MSNTVVWTKNVIGIFGRKRSMSDEVTGNWGLWHIKTSIELDLSAKAYPHVCWGNSLMGNVRLKPGFINQKSFQGGKILRQFEGKMQIMGIAKYTLERKWPWRSSFQSHMFTSNEYWAQRKGVVCVRERGRLVNAGETGWEASNQFQFRVLSAFGSVASGVYPPG